MGASWRNNDRGLSLDMNDLARPIFDGKSMVLSEVVDREEESDDEIIDLAKNEENDYIDEANNSINWQSVEEEVHYGGGYTMRLVVGISPLKGNN
ncbi:hypothetical protein JHK87_006850 [Glycine soja]|nr:hypothetical protein JHK87_006850 [Glycine soja]